MSATILMNLFSGNDFTSAALEYLIDIALKGALILFLTIFLRIFLGKASAAVRHFVSRVVFAGLLFLPLIAVVLPTWRIPMSPQIFAYRSIDKNKESFADYQNGAEEYSPALSSDDSSLTRDFQIENKRAGYQTSGFFLNWRLWLLAVYLAGAVWIAARWLAGIGNIRQAAKRSSLIADPSWTLLIGDLTEQLGVSRKVEIYKSFDASVPFTFGFRRLVVLLPITCQAWAEARRRRILLHEFAHIKRGDYVFQGLMQIVCALYWFNPLVWIAARKMRLDAEYACDDIVLENDMKASDYAEDLLEFARRGTSINLFPAAVPILRQGQLEKRLRLILEPTAARRALTFGSKLLIFAMLAAIIAPLAAAQFTAAISNGDAIMPELPSQDEQTEQSENFQTDLKDYVLPRIREENILAASSVKRNRNFKATEKIERQKNAVQSPSVLAKSPENSPVVKHDDYNYQKTVKTNYNFNYVKTTVQNTIQNTVQRPIRNEVQKTIQKPIQKAVQAARTSPENSQAKGDGPK